MLNLDNTSVCEEYARMCTELQYEDADEDVVVCWDQETNTKEYEKATYGELTRIQSKEEEEVKYNVAQSTNDSVLLERKMRRLNEIIMSLIENYTENSFKNVTMVVQGPTDDDDEKKSRKACKMEMPIIDGNISMSMINEPEQMCEENKKILYARAVHSNRSIQCHMQQIIEEQKPVNEYRSIMMEGMGLTHLESNLHKNDLVVIFQIMQMIEVDHFWHI